MSTARVERVIGLVHELDVLKSERAKIDRKVESVIKEIAQLTGDSTDEPTTLTEADAARAEHEAATSVPPWAPAARLSPVTRTYADLALEFVSTNPTIGYAELADKLYGAMDEAAKNKARSVIYFLVKKAKKLRAREGGGWEPIPPENTFKDLLS